MFIENKYHTMYYNIIHKASQQKRVKNEQIYYESHHIIPSSLGGSNDKTNIVLLTAKEHIVAHHLLCKITEGDAKIKCLRAFHSMCFQDNGGKNKRYPTIGQLAKAREAVSIANSGKRGIKGAPIWSKCETLEEWEYTLKEYVKQNMSDPIIGEIYNVSAQSIHNWRKKLHIDNRRPNIKSKDWLYHHYVELQKSCDDIAKETGCSGTAIQYKLIHFGIPIRTASERQKNRRNKQR